MLNYLYDKYLLRTIEARRAFKLFLCRENALDFARLASAQNFE